MSWAVHCKVELVDETSKLWREELRALVETDILTSSGKSSLLILVQRDQLRLEFTRRHQMAPGGMVIDQKEDRWKKKLLLSNNE